MSIITSVVGTANKFATFIKPHVPTIAVMGGSVAVFGGAFLACKATLKIDDILNEHNAMMNHIADHTDNPDFPEYTDKEVKKDKLQVYAMTSGKFFRAYAPAVGLAAAGFASIFYGFGLIKKWHTLAVSAVSAIDGKFAQYRQNVVNELGADMDKKFAGELLEAKEVEVAKVDPETGESKTETVKGIDDVIEDDFTRIFDYKNPKWENGYLLNDRFLNNLENWYSKHLSSHRMDHLFLNTVLKELGFKETGIGHFYGWTDKPGCSVRFDITPFVRIWDNDNDKQMPLIIPFQTEYDENGIWHFRNPLDEEMFRQYYIDDEHSVGYMLRFNVDTDENGVPKQIYNDVYGKKVA